MNRNAEREGRERTPRTPRKGSTFSCALLGVLRGPWRPLRSFFFVTIFFVIPFETQADEAALDARVTQIAQELRCLVCQNQTLADSDASLARDLRAQIRTLLREGADDAQVRRYMTDRYGDFVLYRPPLKATTLPLWLAPVALLAAGLAVLFGVLRRRARLDDAQFESEPQGVTP
jgi:cytochrome c-type biogenesis protein CcmH